uniref:Uncharacterized protein n=1 Tax=Cannabis sativa TaxID=3483 RepID=A0A803R8R2_CANSA
MDFLYNNAFQSLHKSKKDRSSKNLVLKTQVAVQNLTFSHMSSTEHPVPSKILAFLSSHTTQIIASIVVLQIFVLRLQPFNLLTISCGTHLGITHDRLNSFINLIHN